MSTGIRHPASWRRAMAVLLLALFAPLLPAQERQASEAAVKAAFVFKFADYVEWPEGAFVDAGAALQVGVIGADALAAELERIVAGRTMAGRPVHVRRLRAGDDLAGLQLVFVGAAAADPRAVLAAVGTRPVLTVTEVPAATPPGSVINFVVVDGRVRFDVSLAPAGSRRLRISSRLLAVARTVAEPSS